MGVITAGIAASALSGAVSANQAKKAAGRAGRQAAQAAAEVAAIKNARVPITNPYASTSDLSGLAVDLSSMISNPFANLGVATQAAEIQIEQSNLALSNALDTLATTGASAGGATALAQAALASKKGVSASIEQQEAQNQKARAQGEAQMDQLKMSEAQRLQQVQISEGQRVQSADAAGKQFEMQMKEARSNADLGYSAGKEANALQAQANARAAQGAAWGSAISGAMSFAGQIGAANLGTTGFDTAGNKTSGTFFKAAKDLR
tara:strand:- start:11773 stop:12561 length:789 start_codon:yes stop_codon:yes gene_type:complete